MHSESTGRAWGTARITVSPDAIETDPVLGVDAIGPYVARFVLGDVAAKIVAVIHAADALPSTAFRGADLPALLRDELVAIAFAADSDSYGPALAGMERVAARVDGLRRAGTADANDWITDCVAQACLHPSIDAALAALEARC